MNHSNLHITVKHANRHPYGVKNRLQFFAQVAGKRLVLIESTRQGARYEVSNK